MNAWKIFWLPAGLGMLTIAAGAQTCPVAGPHTASAAEQSYLAADYDKAVKQYREALAGRPHDPDLTAGLVRVLLHQQKPGDALTEVRDALAANPKSAVLLTAKAEAEMRAGVPWEAVQSIGAAMRADPCLPREHLILARIADLDSFYATGRSQIDLAHKLDPGDSDIWGDWIGTLPLRERVAELEKYSKAQTGDDAEERHRTQQYLDRSKKRLTETRRACRLVSDVASTEIPFGPLMSTASHIRSFGLDVKLNQKRARLEIDTGAGGLTISHSVARRLGIRDAEETEIGGIGDQGRAKGSTLYVDSIQIGNLEFHDCAVDVVDDKRMSDSDGLIGMDVFSKFLVTLNYPERKLTLGPLPPRPGQAVTTPVLETDKDDDEAAPAKADGGGDAGTQAKAGASGEASAKESASSAAAKGPFNRYIAPEMKDYTKVYRRGHLLMLPVSLNESKLKLFILDTGAWATTISPEAGREVTKVHTDSSMEVHGISGKVEKVYYADRVKFAFAKMAQEIRYVPSFDCSGISRNTGLEISGFLGASTLRLTTIHIDYRDGLVKFEYDPSKITAEPSSQW